MNGKINVHVNDHIVAWILIRSYWGKQKNLEGQLNTYHPLVYHLVDVAVCAKVLLERNPYIAEAIARTLGADQSPASTLNWVVYLAGIHDIGKFAASFQRQVPELYGSLNESLDARNYDKARHDLTGLGLWLGGSGVDALWRAVLPDTDFYTSDARLLGTASFGHHGTPPDDAKIESLLRYWDPKGIEAARTFALGFKKFLDLQPDLPEDERALRKASFQIAAVINVADWLGSSTDYFPYEAPQWTLEDYWEIAISRARHAVENAGLVSALAPARGDFASMFPGLTPTPLQTAMDEIDLPDQFLLIAEEAAGGGKTEAALTLAARTIASGHSRGLFFGLPTTTTADAQARRQAEIYRRLFGDDAAASLTVAHSNVRRGDRLTGSDASDWLADDRRRRLLADVCVGTVDQALLAAMPARFAAVRLFGLIGKLLILDEVHSFDAYTTTLIGNLLTLHANLGGSAVLLSATMESKTKDQLLKAFAKGAGYSKVPLTEDGSQAYPLITVLGADGLKFHTPDPAPRAPGDKEVAFVRSIEDAEAAVLNAARSGLCVAWIRNTVDQAIESGRRLKAMHDEVDIFHSRFPEVDLEAARNRVLDRFGKDSTAEMRRGRIVVATSVIEQSLDLDFDLVVVDLKPIDSIVQAFGRARRHSRDQHGNPLPDGLPDQRVHRPMLVVSPDPAAEVKESWYSELLGNARFIYPDIGLLWRTAAVLERSGWVRYGNTRDLIEAAYNEATIDLGNSVLETPACLERSSITQEGKSWAERGQAKNVTYGFGPDVGYVHVSGYWDDQRIPTRLGDSMEIVLVRREQNGTVIPYSGSSWTSGRLRLPYRDGVCASEDPSFSAVSKAVPYAVAIEICSTDKLVWRPTETSSILFELTRDSGLKIEKSA